MSFDIRHDAQAQVVYAHVAGAQVKTSHEVLGGCVIADLDAAGQPVGLRFLYSDASDLCDLIDSTPESAWPPGLRTALDYESTTIAAEMREGVR